MRKVAELLLVAAVFEICRRMTKYRLNGRKNHSTRYECCDEWSALQIGICRVLYIEKISILQSTHSINLFVQYCHNQANHNTDNHNRSKNDS